MPITKEMLDEVALTELEYNMIVERLGREPSPVELGMFGSLWSEHCGYKHSKALLKMFPNSGARVLVKAGAENAGAVDIGNGWAITMKIESHNHPSAIEPFQGAATGVGGIVRDVFTMGARPIALLNSLRFGPLTTPRNRYLFNGVVGGISHYGNCLGIPNVGGEIVFADCYAENPLVNAMCVGIIKSDGFVSARAVGKGNTLMLVGADTGRDGIHGASGLASRTFEEERELRSAVQVGNPFMEKCLIEACLEVAATDHIVGMQDLGAAGLTSSSVEMAYKGGTGIRMDLSKVPRREQGMTPYEVMLSESQERMLVVVKRGHEPHIKKIFNKWDLTSEIIGEVTDDGMVRIFDGPAQVVEASARLMSEAPQYRPPSKRPAWLDELQRFDFSKLPLPKESMSQILVRLLGSPNIASRRPVYRQYDHQVIDNTVVGPGGDGALLRIKGTNKGIALATDGDGRLCYLEPKAGGAIAVAEACRNVVCVGAEPIAITDGLNFGNPQKPEVFYQMEQVIAGMAEACRLLNAPVISGNVSLYNETRGEAIYPTPIVGALGLTEDIERRCSAGFKADGDAVYLLGDQTQDAATLGGSEYLAVIHGKVAGMPKINLHLEQRLQRLVLDAIGAGILKSAHDCSHGGLAVTIAESCIIGERGFTGDWRLLGRADAALFGEAQSRIVVSLAAKDAAKLEAMAKAANVPLAKIGVVGGKAIAMPGGVSVPLAEASEAWHEGLKRAVAG
ncbi:MAG: phosphoribosylformylglycinamidine synthase subunit PurL [Chloroflexi bacterium]|nr:phosphoribosylformylglycinamidine synthase subunit PurL [Chloroflexota bacterium]